MNEKLRYTLALVEGHNLFREVYINKLTLLGHKVIIKAENGKSFLEQLEKTASPDFCLLDIKMPVMDGFETAKQLKLKWPNIKIIFFSINNHSTYVRRCLKVGASGFITKDAPPTELIKTLYEIANNKLTPLM